MVSRKEVEAELLGDINPATIFSRKGQAQEFIKKQPLFYDKSGMWWMWNKIKFCWERVDEVDVLNMVEAAIDIDTINTRARMEIINSLKQVGRLNIPKNPEKTWIQFKDEIYDITNGEKFKASPEYFITNPIPYKVSGDPRTPTIEKIFEEWVGKEYVETLYQITAYCLLPDYPLHRLFVFIGGGMNGKSCFLNFLKKFIGVENVTSTELDTLMTSKFEVTRLHKKLIAMMGETNFNEMSRTSMLKKLTGGDLIGMEYKNKTPFEEVNYAKIVIATNNLPATNDKTWGFYRRWLVLDFPNKFSEKKNILNDIPEEEYENLATNSVITLHKLLEIREFHNEGSIQQRADKYEEKSNFLKKFLELFTEYDNDSFITKHSFFNKFNNWCVENRHRKMSETSLASAMKNENVEGDKSYIDWEENGQKIRKQVRIWRGIRWKEQLNM